MTERTPKDFAIEHAEYMAKDAERLLNALSEHAAAYMVLEEGSDEDADQDITAIKERCEQADEALGEHMAHMRSGIYEFRKRRDRALAAPSQPEGAEPTAWRYKPSKVLSGTVLTDDPERFKLATEMGCDIEPLYLHPSQSAGAAAPDERESRDEIRRQAFEEAAKEPRAYAEMLDKGGWGKRFPDELCAIFNASTNMAERIRALSAPKGEEPNHG